MEINNEFIRLARSARFRFFMFRKLPAAYFSGVRIKALSEASCEVTVPFKWFSQNPFRSTYFACLAMAAELSTGALAMMNTYHRKPAVSMLVVKMEAAFVKKATGITRFVCTQGADFSNTVNLAIETRQPQTLAATAIGKDADGNLIAQFTITWSFKAKEAKS